jgi:hypothetical protein
MLFNRCGDKGWRLEETLVKTVQVGHYEFNNGYFAIIELPAA